MFQVLKNVLNTPISAVQTAVASQLGSPPTTNVPKIPQISASERLKSMEQDAAESSVNKSNRTEFEKKASKRKSRLGTSQHIGPRKELSDSEKELVYKDGYVYWMSPCKKPIGGRNVEGGEKLYAKLQNGFLLMYADEKAFYYNSNPLFQISVSNAIFYLDDNAKKLKMSLVEDEEIHFLRLDDLEELKTWMRFLQEVSARWGAVQKSNLEHEIAGMRKQLGHLWEMCQDGITPPKVQKRINDLTIEIQQKDSLIADVVARQDHFNSIQIQLKKGSRKMDLFPNNEVDALSEENINSEEYDEGANDISIDEEQAENNQRSGLEGMSPDKENHLNLEKEIKNDSLSLAPKQKEVKNKSLEQVSQDNLQTDDLPKTTEASISSPPKQAEAKDEQTEKASSENSLMKKAPILLKKIDVSRFKGNSNESLSPGAEQKIFLKPAPKLHSAKEFVNVAKALNDKCHIVDQSNEQNQVEAVEHFMTEKNLLISPKSISVKAPVLQSPMKDVKNQLNDDAKIMKKAPILLKKIDVSRFKANSNESLSPGTELLKPAPKLPSHPSKDETKNQSPDSPKILFSKKSISLAVRDTKSGDGNLESKASNEVTSSGSANDSPTKKSVIFTKAPVFKKKYGESNSGEDLNTA